MISRVTERLRTELAIKNSQRINIPAAVVMTKIDEFYPAFTRQSPLTMVPRDAPAYDERDGGRVHQQVLGLLRAWDTGSIDIHMRLNYSNYRYFAVSALGAPPDHRGGRVSAGGVRPHRVADPVLWLMAERKIISRI